MYSIFTHLSKRNNVFPGIKIESNCAFSFSPLTKCFNGKSLIVLAPGLCVVFGWLWLCRRQVVGCSRAVIQLYSDLC